MPRDYNDSSANLPSGYPNRDYDYETGRYGPVRGQTRNNIGNVAQVETPESIIDEPPNYSPKSNEFWRKFVAEWQSTKENIRLNDQFEKDVMAPALKTYQDRINDVYEAGNRVKSYNPIGISMGDFKTSFTPKRQMMEEELNMQQREQSRGAAGDILRSKFSEADIMQPKKADMDYISQLRDMAKWQQELKNKINITENMERPDDQGTWLDAIGDIIGVGGGATDLIGSIGKLFK